MDPIRQTLTLTGFSCVGDDPATQDLKTIVAAVAKTRGMIAARLSVNGRQNDTDQVVCSVLSTVWERTAISGRADEDSLGAYTNGTAQHMVRQHIATLRKRHEILLDPKDFIEIPDSSAPDILDRLADRDEARTIARHVRATIGETRWQTIVHNADEDNLTQAINRSTLRWIQQVARVARTAVRLAYQEPWLTMSEVQLRCVHRPQDKTSTGNVHSERVERDLTVLKLVAWRVFREERLAW